MDIRRRSSRKKTSKFSHIESILVYRYNISDDYGESPMIITGFDMDETLITTKGPNKFPKDADDWQWRFSRVPVVLEYFSSIGYRVVIFSNQAGISTGRTKLSHIKEKTESIALSLGIPIEFFICTDYSVWNRKPGIGLWQKATSIIKENRSEDTFFTGDAAGRPDDFGFCDRAFAINLGITFNVPEFIFSPSDESIPLLPPLKFDPRTYEIRSLAETKKIKIEISKMVPEAHLAITIGGPGSGKSYFINTIMYYYKHLEDEIFTKTVLMKASEIYIKRDRKKVIIDGFNATKKARKEWIDFADLLAIKIICVHFPASHSEMMHRNKYRERITNGRHKAVPSITITTFLKAYEPPTEDEGFTKIIDISFKIDGILDKNRVKMFRKF